MKIYTEKEKQEKIIDLAGSYHPAVGGKYLPWEPWQLIRKKYTDQIDALEKERDTWRNDFNAVAAEACSLQDALGCPCEMENAQEKAMERIRDLIAADGLLGDAMVLLQEMVIAYGPTTSLAEERQGMEARMERARKLTDDYLELSGQNA